MKLESQVCSLELAKKLKELGVEQESCFYYCYSKRTEKYWIYTGNEFKKYDKSEDCIILDFSAYTAAELGNALPNRVTVEGQEPFDNFTIIIRKSICVTEDRTEVIYVLNYECDSTEGAGENAWLTRKLTNDMWDTNLANAMAKMLIYLIENKLVSVEDINRRLAA